jgi:hypothetical protein
MCWCCSARSAESRTSTRILISRVERNFISAKIYYELATPNYTEAIADFTAIEEAVQAAIDELNE